MPGQRYISTLAEGRWIHLGGQKKSCTMADPACALWGNCQRRRKQGKMEVNTYTTLVIFFLYDL